MHLFFSSIMRVLSRSLVVILFLYAHGSSMGQGTDTVHGKFQNPINPGPDPWMVYFEGNYYLSTTGGDAIRIWKAPTLERLKTAPPVTVWRDSDPSRSSGIWAPEFHFIQHHWFL